MKRYSKGLRRDIESSFENLGFYPGMVIEIKGEYFRYNSFKCASKKRIIYFSVSKLDNLNGESLKPKVQRTIEIRRHGLFTIDFIIEKEKPVNDILGGLYEGLNSNPQFKQKFEICIEEFRKGTNGDYSVSFSVKWGNKKFKKSDRNS